MSLTLVGLSGTASKTSTGVVGLAVTPVPVTESKLKYSNASLYVRPLQEIMSGSSAARKILMALFLMKVSIVIALQFRYFCLCKSARLHRD